MKFLVQWVPRQITEFRQSPYSFSAKNLSPIFNWDGYNNPTRTIKCKSTAVNSYHLSFIQKIEKYLNIWKEKVLMKEYQCQR